MFPLLALTALATAFGAYQYGKNKQAKKQQNTVATQTKSTTDTDSVAKNVNNYNYYTSEVENGDSLFNQNKKRTLFGSSQS